MNVVWINPVYSSPNDDNGYDVSDYRKIMKDFGTMSDFTALIKGMHEHGIKLVMDLVVNHSSDEHIWFKQSRSSRTIPIGIIIIGGMLRKENPRQDIASST